jgi:uncharacterized protein
MLGLAGRYAIGPAAMLLALTAGCAKPQPTTDPASSTATEQPTIAAQAEFPALTGRVVDAANIISDDVEARLTEKSARLEKEKGPQFAIATVTSLGGRSMDEYGTGLANHWRLGSKEKNDGVLLTVAPKERKVRIDVGFGLENALTDQAATQIIEKTIVPRFKAGDMPGGIEAGADAIIAQLTKPAGATVSSEASPSAATVW